MTRDFKACLFDMDGLLLDTEIIYTRSFSQVLKKYGCPEGLTWDVKVKLQGVPGPEACQIVIDSYGLGGEIDNLTFYKETSDVQESMWPECELLPGVERLIKKLKSNGIPIAVCTSSNEDKFELKTSRHKKIFDLFENNIITGDNKAIKGKGKPLPFIWWLGLDLINNANNLDIKPEECLVFEDAAPGALSGKRSGGYVIWVPDENAIKVLANSEINSIIGESNENGKIYKSLEDFKIEDYITLNQ